MASSSLGHPYQDKGLEEIIPQFMQQPKLSSASLVQARRKSRFVPQGASEINQSGPNSLNFIISDSSSFLDPNSTCLSGKFKSTDTASTPAAPAGALLVDGIVSLFQRLRVYVGGVLLEDINVLNTKELMEVYTSMTQEHYNTQGSALALFHKFNPLYTKSDGAPCRKNNPAARKEAALRVQQAADGVYFSLPMSYISGFFRNEKAFPLLAAGQVQVTIDLVRGWEGFVSVGNPAQTPHWTLTDLTMEMDCLTMHPLYTQALVSLIRAPGMGYTCPVTTHNVQQISIVGGDNSKSIAVPQAVNNLRQVSWVIQPTASLSLPDYDKSTFPINTYEDAYITVGSHRFPESPAVGTARAYQITVDADNQLGSINGAPIIDVENYCGATVTGSIGRDASCDAFVWSISLDKIKDTYVASDGISGASLGGQIVLNVNNNVPVGGGTLTVVAETTRFLSLAEGRINVV